MNPLSELAAALGVTAEAMMKVHDLLAANPDPAPEIIESSLHAADALERTAEELASLAARIRTRSAAASRKSLN